MNWWRVGATSWGQTSPNRPIVMAVVKRKQEKQINKSWGQQNKNKPTRIQTQVEIYDIHINVPHGNWQCLKSSEKKFI